MKNLVYVTLQSYVSFPLKENSKLPSEHKSKVIQRVENSEKVRGREEETNIQFGKYRLLFLKII